MIQVFSEEIKKIEKDIEYLKQVIEILQGD